MLLNDRGMQIEIWGESHGKDIGLRLSGIPQGEKIDLEELQQFTDRRKSSKSSYSTSRLEDDIIIVEQGIKNGATTGETIIAKIENKNHRSKDYDNLTFVPRPSHADYPAFVKYDGKLNMAGGGKYSGRLTAPMCIAGGIASQILKNNHNITVGAYISSIGGIKGKGYENEEISAETLIKLKKESFPTLEEKDKELFLQKIEEARMKLDSLGGIIEAVALGLETGTGETHFDSMESRISSLLFGIPAVKGVEFGSGFGISSMKGSEANDSYYYDESGLVKTRSNHNGGLLGGMSNGMPLTVRAAIKPVASILQKQQSVDLIKKENTELQIVGRHDVCIVPRAVVVVESMLALAILSYLE